MLAAVVLTVAAPADAVAKAGAAFGFSDSALERGYAARDVLPLLDRTGASVYRMDLRWDYVEPQPGAWQWSGYDRRYRDLRTGGVRPLAVLRSAPRWARDDGTIAGALVDGGEGPPSRRHLAQWANFVHRVVVRYPGLAGVEIFNEPNYAINNWRPQADPTFYTEVLRSANAAVQAVRPRIPVVFGGLLNVSDSERPVNMSPERFLREAYAAGARGEMDAIAIHPYSYLYDGPPEDPRSPYRRMLAGMRQVRDSAGDAQTPFWITETGYPTASPEARGVSQGLQASRLVEITRLALAEPDVEMVLLYSLVDQGEDPRQAEHGFGVVRTDLTPKPALKAIAALTGAPRLELSARRRRYRAKGRLEPALRLTLSEPARVSFTLRRRHKGRRAVRRFERSLGSGRHLVRRLLRRDSRRRLRRGLYLITARATDRTGEESATGRVRIRVVR